LWASTGTKNHNYSDVLYVEELIGPDTVKTMPPATLDAFRDHGRVRLTLTENVEEAISIMDLVEQVGIPFKELTDKLLDDGVKQFAEAFDKLLQATERSGKASDHDPVEFVRVELLKQLYQEQHYS
jgi:transaldolase/glucose-6-phosphate isomerase